MLVKRPSLSKRPLTSVCLDESGVILALFALLLPVLIIAIAILINLSGFYVLGHSHLGPLQEKAQMQIAADAAARAGSVIKVMNGSTYAMVKNEACALAGANNYSCDTVTVNVPPTAGNYRDPVFNAVEVLIDKDYALPLLSNLFGWADFHLQVRAVAAWNFAPCIVALNRTTNPPTGITFSSNNTHILASCGIYSNNPDPISSITANGTCGSNGPIVQTYYAGMVGGSAGNNVTGICGIDNGQPIVAPNLRAVDDPFAEMSFPETGPVYSSPADFGGSSNSWDTITRPLTPGVYTDRHMTFNGGGSVTFEPGVYYFRGSLTINNATVNAPYTAAQMSDSTFIPSDGVTFVFENNSGGIAVAAGSTLTLTAPATGPSAGMAIVDYDTSQVSFNSNSTGSNVTGVIYAPNALVSYNAPVTGLANCLTIVANAVSVAGGGAFGGACPSKFMDASGFRAAGLVE